MSTQTSYRELRALSDDELVARLEQLDADRSLTPWQLELHEIGRRQAARQADETRNVADAVKLLAVWIGVLAAIGLFRVVVAIADAMTR
jgi:hypothetical protein